MQRIYYLLLIGLINLVFIFSSNAQQCAQTIENIPASLILELDYSPNSVPHTDSIIVNGVNWDYISQTGKKVQYLRPAEMAPLSLPGSYKVGNQVCQYDENGVLTNEDVPLIYAISPDKGYIGTIVNVFGENFSNDPEKNNAFLNGVKCEVLHATENEITIEVPEGASTGVINISVDGLSIDGPSFEINNLYKDKKLTNEDAVAGFVIGQLLIEYNKGKLSSLELNQVNTLYRFDGQQYYAKLNYYIAFISNTTDSLMLETINKLNDDDRIKWATVNQIFESNSCTNTKINDPAFINQLHLSPEFLNIEEAFESNFPKMGEGIKIAIIDSGIDAFDEVEIRSSYPKNKIPTENHGTIVSSIVAGKINGNCGIGVSPKSEVLNVCVSKNFLGKSFILTNFVANGIRWATDQGARVINLSLGNKYDIQAQIACTLIQNGLGVIKSALEYADDREIVIVASAGNNNGGRVDSPACDPRVIAVGSINKNRIRSSFSNKGEGLDFVGLGENIATRTFVFNEVINKNEPRCLFVGDGTSFSAPQVAGLAALILAEQPYLSPTAVKSKIIEEFTEDLGLEGWDEDTGYGLIRYPSIYISSLSPEDGSFVNGGEKIIPEVFIGPQNAIKTINGELEFFVNGMSLGIINVSSLGKYKSSSGYFVPNILNGINKVHVAVELRLPEDTILVESNAKVKFSPKKALRDGKWSIKFDLERRWGSKSFSWTGEGTLIQGLTGNEFTMTVKNLKTGKSKTCSYTDNNVFFSIRENDIYNPEYWVFHFDPNRCMNSAPNIVTEYNILNIDNPEITTTEIFNNNQSCFEKAELKFNSMNLESISLTRKLNTNCIGRIEEESIILKRIGTIK